ncbi:MAG TPA: GNAT family N-acetyltransferase [Terriglobales bacterium]|jgi:RimJ/RimL family protein N-acetyltransferase|nr:GNAT family N-acetyltransferase [Terriglobales bacterium]
MSATEAPRLVLCGKRVTLRTPQFQDADRSYKWFADPEITRYLPLAGKGKLPMDAIREFIARVSGSDRPEQAVSIEAEGEYIGCGGLRNIDGESAEFSIVIGERRFQGRGIAHEAAMLLLRHAFDTLGLKTVWLMVRADNQRALKLFERLGFVRDQLLRGAVVVDGQPKDKWKMTLSRESIPK